MGHDPAKANEDTEHEKNQIRFWLDLMRVHGMISSELNRKLSAEAGVSLTKFDAMSHLYRYPDGLSMTELSDALRVSNGNVSGLVNRLIKEGFVFKEVSDTDRRSYQVRLSELGKKTFEGAMLTHRTVLANIFSNTSPEELSTNLQSLRSLSSNLASEE